MQYNNAECNKMKKAKIYIIIKIEMLNKNNNNILTMYIKDRDYF